MTGAEKLIDAVGYLDDDLIEEAERIRFEVHPRKTYSKPVRFAALAACCAMLVFGAFLFPRFFIRLGSQSPKDAAAPAAAEEAEAVMAGGATSEAASTEEAAAEAVVTEEAAIEEPANEEAKAETVTMDEIADEGVAEYGAADILLWPDTSASITLEGVLYQSATEEDLNGGIRETKLTLDLFDLGAPVGVVGEASDEKLLGAACYAATAGEVRYLLVEQPDGLYLFREIGH